MRKTKSIFLALLFGILMAVNVWADDGVGQRPDYFTDYYMIVECAEGGINIYSEADYESSKLNDELIINGTAIHVEGEKTGKDNQTWAYAQHHGMYGYLPSDHLKPSTRTEAIESEFRAHCGEDAEFEVTAEASLILYNGPGEKFGKVAGAEDIPAGTTFKVYQFVETSEGKYWGKTYTDLAEGWVDLNKTDYKHSEETVDIVEDKADAAKDKTDVVEDKEIISDINEEEADAITAESKTAAGEAKAKPEPTATPAPTETPEPTATPAPTATPTPAPTATSTPTPEPTATSTPTPEPTATTAPTSTPKPTATAEPTATATAEPTATEEPTATPTEEVTPTKDVTPTEEAKAEEASAKTEKSTLNGPIVWGVCIGILILVILLLAYFFRKKK